MRITTGILIVLLQCLRLHGLQMERKPHPCPIVPRSDGHRPGHLEQLGCQRPPLRQVKEYFEAPTPRELYENHVNPYVPAVIRNALKGSPALSKWTTDQYLIDTYGDQEVLVEKKYEDRKSEPKRMEIKEFLANYKDQNWYVVTILPNAMRRDIRVPKPLMCSSFNKNLAELNLWIGTKGTRSVLHHDADNIMHCVVYGFKDWILIDRKYKDKLDMVVGREGQGSGFSHLDVDRINEDINPEVWDIPWQYVTLRSGDCLYLPHKYLHQVRSFNRTISSTFLWYPEGEFNDDDCDKINYDDYLSLADTYVHWTYEKGQETVDMGYGNPIQTKNEFLHLFDALKVQKLDVDTFVFLTFTHMSDAALESWPKVLEFFVKFDNDKDGFITRDEFMNVDMEDLKEYCRASDNPHGPTKSMVPKSDKYSAKSTEFGPRPYKQRFIDSTFAKIFMRFVMRVKGTDGRITYPVFKKIIHVRDGHIADAFILFDKNFDGVITSEELQNTTQKRYRDFSRMKYTLIGTKISGGGQFESEVLRGNMFFLDKLNTIPKELVGDEQKDERQEESESIDKVFAHIRDVVGNGVDKSTFVKSFSIESDDDSPIDSFGSSLIFSLLNQNDDDLLTPSDLDEFLENRSGSEELRAEYKPLQLLASVEEQLTKMKDILPDLEEFKLEKYGNVLNVAEKFGKTEL